MKKEQSVLVRNGRHERPLLAVLKRYEIGQKDHFDRGRWIKETDLPKIKEMMETDPTAVRARQPDGSPHIAVQGTCMHNHVGPEDFERLFLVG